MNKKISFSILLAVLIELLPCSTIFAQTYTVSPTGWTSKPSTNVTVSGNTWIAATTEGIYIKAKAVVSGSSLTFYVQKSSGTFNNKANVRIREDMKISGNTVTDVGTTVATGTVTAGSSGTSIDYAPDFSNGSHTYHIILTSGSIIFYTNPITVTVNSTKLATPDYTKFSATSITTTGYTAKWAAVSGATKYGILVRSEDGTYTSPVFGSEVTSTSCKVTGLKSGTSYYFQIQARNATQKSDWSKSIANPVTTKEEAKLATPDYTKFSATNITTTGFTAKWAAVSGATQYDILVKKASDNDYDKPVFNGGSSITSCEITGLQPGTSYHFQVKAKNNTQKSDWSKSIKNAVKTASTETTPVNLTIYAIKGFDGKEPLVVGQTYHYNVWVRNNGSNMWNGSFYLKDGKTNINPWEKITIPKNVCYPLEFDYTPKETGTKNFVLWYQTNGTGDGVCVPTANSSTNVMTIKVIEDPSIFTGLNLNATINCPSSIELGKSCSISATVINTSTDSWTGTIYLASDGVELNSKQVTLKKNGNTKISTSWKPTTFGEHQIAVYYKNNNSDKWHLVSGDKYANPLNVIVTSNDALTDASNVILKNLTKDVFPNEVTEGSEVYNHFRLIDEKGNPLKGMQLYFNCDGSSKKNTIITKPSDNRGYAVLELQTSGKEAIAARGETIKLTCTKIINENGKEVKFSGSNSDKQLSLKIHKGNTFSQGSGFENVEKMKVTLELGGSAKLGWSTLKEKDNAKLSLGFPLTLGFKWDNSGNINEYSLDAGLKFSASLGGVTDKDKREESTWEKYLPSISGKGSIGLKRGYSTSNPKDALIRYIMNWVDSYTEGTDWQTDLAVKAMRWWYDKKRDDKLTKSWYFSYGLSASGNLLNTWPGFGMIKSTIKPIISINELKLGLNGNITIEPSKTKTDFAKGLTLKGSSSSLKVGGDFNVDAKVHNLFDVAKSHWEGIPLIESYYKEILSDFYYKSTSLNYAKNYSMKHDEMFNSSNGRLEEVSQEMSLSSSWEFSVNDIFNGDWKPLSASIGCTNTSTSKVSSKGEWAAFMAHQAASEKYREQVFRVFPNLSGKSIFCPPAEIYHVWQDDFGKPLGVLASITPNPTDCKLNEALKVEHIVSSELDADLSIRAYDWGWCKLYIDVGVTLGLDNKPSESYYSVPDRRFFPVVLRPATSIGQTAGWLVDYTSNEIKKAFESEKKDIMAAWEWIQQKYDYVVDKAGEIVDNTSDYIVDNIIVPAYTHYYNYKSGVYDVNVRHAIKRHPLLAEKEQLDICKFSFGINTNVQNFVSGVCIEVPHHYPAGDLLGVTDKGDTLFVVSEVCNLKAIHGKDTLKTSQTGKFTIESKVGADDLTPFGFSETQSLDVYYSEEGSKIWHYVGPAGTKLESNKLGVYMMATSIKNDIVAPEIIADLDDKTGLMHIKVNENIGLRINTLQVLVNGELREVEMINESNFELQLSKEDIEYMLVVDISVYDLAGNKGSQFLIFNIDKPEPSDIEEKQIDNKTEIQLNRRTLTVNGATPNATVTVYAINGLVQAKEQTDVNGQATIDLNSLLEGVYIITTSNGKAKKFYVK